MIIALNKNETLTDALKRANPFDTILLCPKVYYEKVDVNVENITIEGSLSGESQIVFDDYANKLNDDGREYNTFRSYSVIVTAKNVKMKNLTIKNSTLEPKLNGQAVALSVCADGFYAENIALYSLQDTLFIAPLPDDLVTRYRGFLAEKERFLEGEATQLFKNCKIYGSVDYVFGCGSAWFLNCEFINVSDGRLTGYVAAPAHSLKQSYGFTFINSVFSAEENLNADIYLARPWREYGKCDFINCKYGKHILKAGFNKWNDTARDKTARFSEYPLANERVKWAKALPKEKADELIVLADKLFSKYNN